MENEKKAKKDPVKGKVILFVIGVLVGAVISTASFFVYTTTLGNSNDAAGQMNGGGSMPSMPSGQGTGNQSSDGQNQPPEKPSDDKTQEDD